LKRARLRASIDRQQRPAGAASPGPGL
jgi:hypothetical protein